MKVLITGISSKVPNLVARRLLAAGHEVVGIDRRPWLDAPPEIEVHEVDLCKPGAEAVFRKARPEAVIHMATVANPFSRSEERYGINLDGTRAVFDCSRAYGVKQVVFVGRHTYYGAAPAAPLYHNEEDPPTAMTSFPELSDLVAADLCAATALWRSPELVTSVLRICYTLGATGTGTLCNYLSAPWVPSILGFDPLFQFIGERDVARALELALEKKLRGVFNVAGPQPVPLSVLIHETGRRPMPIPRFLFNTLRGRFGLPRLPPGALEHIKYPVVIDGAAFRAATGFTHEIDEVQAMHEFRDAFPPPKKK